jgi:hypothetical protein
MHEQRPAIDHALVDGRSAHALAARYQLSHDAVSRHKATHMPEHLVKAREAEEVGHALDIVQQLKLINEHSVAILTEARQAGNPLVALKAVERIHKQVELQARLLGELNERPQVNVLVASEWLAIRSTLLRVLQPNPEARAAVAEHLLHLDGADGLSD